MADQNQFFMLLGIGIGVVAGASITSCVANLALFLGETYRIWHEGRDLAHLVTEKEHKRRMESLAKMIELEGAKKPVATEEPVIATQEPIGLFSKTK